MGQLFRATLISLVDGMSADQMQIFCPSLGTYVSGLPIIMLVKNRLIPFLGRPTTRLAFYSLQLCEIQKTL